MDEKFAKFQEQKKNGPVINQTSSGFRITTKKPTSAKPRPQSYNPKTIRNLSNSVPIEIMPTEAIFKDITTNQIYEMTLLVRNLTKLPRRIRVFQPKTSKFKCDYDMQGSIAPGLSIKLVVFFETSTPGDFHDSIRIISDENFSAEVPIHAFSPQALIKFDNFLNIGFVKLGKEKTEKLVFKNEGNMTGKVELKNEKFTELKIDPMFVSVKPKSEQEVKVIFKPKEIGVFRGLIEVLIEGQLFHNYIDVNATSVEYNRFIMDEFGNQCTSFDFGTMYYGQPKDIRCFLVNNTPKSVKFTSKFRIKPHNENDLIQSESDIHSFFTPNQLAIDMKEKIISSIPSEANIPPFGQLPITLRCKSKLTEELKAWTRDYATSDKEMNPFFADYFYEVRFDFDEESQNQSEPLLANILGRGVCPTVKVSKTTIFFGECPMHERRDIYIELENTSEDLPVDFALDKVPYFYTDRERDVLAPNQKSSICVTFHPRNIGHYNAVLELTLMRGMYSISIKVSGNSSTIAEKKQKKRGPESMPADFDMTKVFVGGDPPQKAEKLLSTFNDQSLKPIDKSIAPEKKNIMFDDLINKKKYNNFLREEREKRFSAKKDKHIKEKMNSLTEKMKEMGIIKEPTKNEEEEKADPPIDYEFIFGLQEKKLDSPRLPLPPTKDQLFVTKPIDKYEPMIAKISHMFSHNPSVPIKKKFPSEPKSHSEICACSALLTADNLLKIYASPNQIEFGSVYVNSTIIKTFAIRNDLRSSIIVRLEYDNEELRGTYTRPQVIPSSKVAGFEIQFCSPNKEKFKGVIRYIINDKHVFEILVTAQVDPVNLDINPKSLRFQFADTNEEMFTKEKLTITNAGNAAGKFEWVLNDNKIFVVTPSSGEVAAGSTIDVEVTYRPSGNSAGKPEEEKLIMKVVDGFDQLLKCTGIVNETRAGFKEASIALGEIPICIKEDRLLSLKNYSKYISVFQVQSDKLPRNTEVTPLKGRIMPDDTVFLRATFFCKEEISVNSEIVVNVRGGKPVKIPFSVNTVIPRVRVLEEEFDFGGVTTLGNSGSLKMTIVNESTIEATLYLDLREREDCPKELEGIECLDVYVSREVNQDESQLLHSIQEKDLNEDANDPMNESLGGNYDGDSDNSESEANNVARSNSSRYFKITVKPNSSNYFNMKFSPSDVKTYNLELPLTLAGFGRLDALARPIVCKGLKPRIVLDTSKVEFKKKIITTPEKCVPSDKEFTIANPDSKPVKWKIDITGFLKDSVFSISPSEGRIDSGQTILIRAFFNPMKPGRFEQEIPLYIDDETGKPYLEMMFIGMAANPRLNFDRREIIMPIVPLSIVSRCEFRIFNDGYENLTLRHNIPQELGPVNLTINYPEKNNLGVTKTKVKVIVEFSNKRPFSFTTRLDFLDDNGKIYSIPISGTTDNCLFTNFPFFQRCGDEYTIEANENKPLFLVENPDNSDIDDIDNRFQKSGNFTSSKGGSVSGKSSRSILGYSPIPTALLERSSDYLMRWLNSFALVTPIHNFPNDIVMHHGTHIFELIAYLTGKMPQFKAKIDGNFKRHERVKIIYKQYDDLIRYLKENGALLNTIRPQYLLSFTDFNTYLKANPVEYVNSAAYRITEHRYHYLSVDSWLLLIYQILKVFYLTRINTRTLKSSINISPEKSLVSEFYMEGSNFISGSEGILLRWMELNYENVKQKPCKRLRNFDSDLRDGIVLAACIQNFCGIETAKSLKSLKQRCSVDDDFRFNCERIFTALHEIGLQTHITAKDLFSPFQRENILFVIQLFHSLHHYIPKGDPVIFSCVLGEEIYKYVELNNPTQKPISYWVKKEGHPDFSIETDQVRLEPRSGMQVPYQFKVKFTSRISTPVTGRIIFTNKKEGNAQAAALVFDLKSEIIERRSIESHEIKAKLYEMEEMKIQIKNIFTTSPYEYADFQIRLLSVKEQLIIKKEEPEGQKKSPRNKNQKKKKDVVESNVGKPSGAELDDATSIPPFFCKTEKIKIKRGESAVLPIQFMPFSYETHKCHIVFCDQNVGEFQHEITGTTLLPDPIMEIKPPQNVYVDTNVPIDIPLQFKYEKQINAKKTHENRLVSTGKTKEKEAYVKFKSQIPPQESLIFEVELTPPTPYINLPITFTVYDTIKRGKKERQERQEREQELMKNENQEVAEQPKIEKKQTIGNKKSLDQSFDSKSTDTNPINADGYNKLMINLNFKHPVKDYGSLIILKNALKTDVRVYKLTVTVAPKIVKATLEMKVPGGDEVKQEIPVVNNSDKDWPIKATLSMDPNKNGQYFYGQKDFVVKKKSTGYYTISYKPPWIMRSESRLTLFNPQTNDLFEYELIGIGEEPLAKDHIVLNCVARRPTRKEIEVENPYKDKPVTYKVETDLVNADGPSEFNLAPGKAFKYPLTITPVLGGMYTGSITFYEAGEDNKKYIWYTILVVTDRPKSEKTIDLISFVRKAVAFDISLNNPLKEPSIFEVIIEGEGLIGESNFSLLPGQTSTYELVFSPLRAFKGKGSVAFIHERLGEIWYDLNLNSEENAVIRLPTLKAELGKSQTHQVMLENPSQKEASVTFKITNMSNFDVIPEKITIPPCDSAPVNIRYTPSELDINEAGEVIFESEEIGRWHYMVYGIGLPPTQYEPKILAGSLNKDLSSTLSFRNPFKEQIVVQVTLNGSPRSMEVFQLLLKKNKVSVPPLSIFQIPFSFTPKEISEYHAYITVYMNEKVQWKFPLHGITESYSNTVTYNFKVKCRQTLEQQLKIQLPGLPKQIDRQEFNLTVSYIPSEFETLVKKCFQIHALKNYLESPDQELVYHVEFKPWKPFKTNIDILISRPTGGRWKFKIQLESSLPEEDDVIVISSPMNKTTSVSFKLHNRSKGYTSFQAFFSPDSDPEFAVIPKSGELEPGGRDGKNFIVSFTPVEYGKVKEGKLIIETDELYWSYLIKGTLPLYKPPKLTESKVKQKLEPLENKKRSNMNSKVIPPSDGNKLNKSYSLKDGLTERSRINYQEDL